MDYKVRIQQIRTYIQKKWFNIALIVLAAMLVLNKDLSIRFNIKAPVNKEKSGLPGVKHPNSSKKAQKKGTKVTDNLQSAIGQTKSQGSLADPFGIFTPPSIPENEQEKERPVNNELPSISIDQVNAFIKRFGDVAKNEKTKFNVPASIILAQALLASHAGVSQVSKTSNNYFSLPCNSNWSGPEVNFSGQCYRKYESAWFSFRDHTKFITSGNFKHLTNLASNDYARWAKGLELGGYNSTPGYANHLIRTIEEFDLQRFDN